MKPRIAVWTVVRNDEFYIGMALQSVAAHVGGIVVVDTGSTDGTLDEIKRLQTEQGADKILLLRKDFGGVEKFDREYREAEARNYAMEKTIEKFRPDWLVQLDADEVYNERFWECVDDAFAAHAMAFGHSTNMPVTPGLVSSNPPDMVMWDGRWRLFDPHVRSWSTKLAVVWVKPEGRHVVPRIAGLNQDIHHDYVTKDHVHFHLHRAFGPKSLHGWFTNFKVGWRAAAETLGLNPGNVSYQKWYQDKYPQHFTGGKFSPPTDVMEERMRYTIPITHPLPDHVVRRWLEWLV